MAVVIDELAFVNYRQYGTSRIKLDSSSIHKLTAFIAKNGTGKTTLLNAITWCLYNEEPLSDVQKTRLPLINNSVIANSLNNATVSVSVSMRILDDTNVVTFKRTVPCIINKDGAAPRVIENTDEFIVTQMKSDSTENAQTYEGADADIIVKKYFDKAIFDFYFFDGENLKNYFVQGRSTRIKESIYNIAQVTLLNNAIGHVDTMEKEKQRALSKSESSLPELLDKLDKAQKEHDNALNEKDKLEAEIKNLENEVTRIDGLLSSIKPLLSLQNERKEKEGDRAKQRKEKQDLDSEYSSFLREYYTYIRLYPDAVKLLRYINEKTQDGKLPPEIDRKYIESIITNMGDSCPVCDQPVEGDAREHALRHLESLLEKFEVSSLAATRLSSIRTSLRDIVDKAEKYPDIRDNLKVRQEDLRNRMQKTNDRLEEISSLISNFPEEDSSEANAASVLESRRTKYSNDITEKQIGVGYQKHIIESRNEEIKELQEKIKKETEKATSDLKLQDEVWTLRTIKQHYISVRDDITARMREEIQTTTDRLFKRMSSKTNTFGTIAIDEDYNVEVFDIRGQKMTGSLSATEQMALAYAFTLAIHDASGKNCPLVIDSPLGRVSDTNRENMARALYEVSREKQIIMLFTPDEFSEEVRRVYSRGVDIKDLQLNDDETTIVAGVELA